MTATPALHFAKPLHPFHSVLLICAFPLFLGGLVADIAYARTYQIQWDNFAAWLIAGAMVFTGLALAWSLFNAVLTAFRDRPALIGLGLLAATFILGLFNSFTHARDAWGAMPAALILSLFVTPLAGAAIWVGVLAPHTRARA